MTIGHFRARGVSGGLGNTSNNQPQVAVELEILEPGYEGNRMTWFGFFTDKTTERTFEALRLLGWEGDDLTDLTGIDRNEISLAVEQDTYEGKTRLKAAWINALGGLALKAPMVPEEARAFAAKMRAAAAASRLKAGTRPAASSGREDDPPPF